MKRKDTIANIMPTLYSHHNTHLEHSEKKSNKRATG